MLFLRINIQKRGFLGILFPYSNVPSISIPLLAFIQPCCKPEPWEKDLPLRTYNNQYLNVYFTISTYFVWNMYFFSQLFNLCWDWNNVGRGFGFYEKIFSVFVQDLSCVRNYFQLFDKIYSKSSRNLCFQISR